MKKTLTKLLATVLCVSIALAVGGCNGKANATEYNESRTAWMKAVSDRLQAKYDYLFRTKILDFYRGIPLTL